MLLARCCCCCWCAYVFACLQGTLPNFRHLLLPSVSPFSLSTALTQNNNKNKPVSLFLASLQPMNSSSCNSRRQDAAF
ncbi:hypothetical protein GQ42DRAFT_88944 [Ramicandelaber brevisporus]|nr:hypothetical protein GQ42DRAFT_88944 [Ramicandelaber brevisporus]